MDESQQELYRACLVFPARDGRSATAIEQGFMDRGNTLVDGHCWT